MKNAQRNSLPEVDTECLLKKKNDLEKIKKRLKKKKPNKNKAKKKNVLVTINKRLKIQEPNKNKAIKIHHMIRNK